MRALAENADLGAAEIRAAVRSWLSKYSLLVLLIGLIALFSILEPDTFATSENFKSILVQRAVPLVVTLAALIPIVAGGFDLSVGYVLGFAAVVAAAAGSDPGLGAGIAIMLTIAAGALIGTISGTLVTRFGVNSLIGTLGVGLAVSGFTVGVSGGQNVFEGIPAIFREITSTKILGIDSAVWIAFATVLAAYVVLAKTPFGRKMYAVGGNERVAELNGINTGRVKLIAFCAAGVIAALGGILQLGQTGSASPSFGPELLLPAFAAVFLGATSVKPGFFNVWGTVLAIFVLAVGFSGLSLMGVPFWWSPVFDGVALLVGVLLAGRRARAIS